MYRMADGTGLRILRWAWVLVGPDVTDTLLRGRNPHGPNGVA